jgi:hypothetical protein
MQSTKIKETHNGKYNKGESGNLRGRPIEPKEALGKLKKFTDKKSATAYKHLSQAIEAKEPWAVELCFQELMPKSDPLHLRIDQNNPDKANAIINAILVAISEREYLTVKESCQLLDTLVHLQESKIGVSLPKFN